jgi:hypothetical protein
MLEHLKIYGVHLEAFIYSFYGVTPSAAVFFTRQVLEIKRKINQRALS